MEANKSGEWQSRSTEAVLGKLADQIDAGLLRSAKSQTELTAPVTAVRTEMAERRKLLMRPLTEAGVLSYRVNRTAFVAALWESAVSAQESLGAVAAADAAAAASAELPEQSEREERHLPWRAELAELKTMVGRSLAALVVATNERASADGLATWEEEKDLTMAESSREMRPRAEFDKPVKPTTRSERGARFAAHGIVLTKKVIPWKATPSRPVKFSLLDTDALGQHPGLVDGGDPWSSVFWASKAGDIHAGCHYRPIIL